MSRPAEGTPCIECHAKGHFCAAQITVGHEALCLDCADGQPCLVAVAKARTAEIEHKKSGKSTAHVRGEEVVMSTHAVMGPEMIDPHARKKEEKPMVKERKGAQISPDIREAIKKADPKIPHSQLAAELGISDASVIKYRREAGIFVPLTRGHGRGGRKSKPDNVDALRRVFQPPAKPTYPECRHKDVKPMNAIANAHALVRIEIPIGAGVSVRGELTEPECMAIFSGLPVEEKARLLTDTLRARLGF